MSMSEGPWKIKLCTDAGVYTLDVHAADDSVVHIGRPDKKEDSKAIAALPDLIMAIKLLQSAYYRYGDGCNLNAAMRNAVEVLAKATGE